MMPLTFTSTKTSRNQEIHGRTHAAADTSSPIPLGLVLVPPLRQCDWYCEFASHHPNPVVCPQCGSNDLVDTANEFSITLQRITVNLHSEVQNMLASKVSVEALEEVVVTEEELCPVCKQNMGVGEMAKRMPCKHSFHVKFKLPKDDKAAMRERRDPGLDASVG
ncbi:hypothetical protein QJS10_CPB11g01985 [Acorus calamus]|uniref:Uncharacterized protein n=1 Tax=Acorus calamus TaxID=4465 RepID=A0AAV9DRZ1_ACOCL|nr:hypothetical protein QJS10_CPB11g01985 [Acorus calamus]